MLRLDRGKFCLTELRGGRGQMRGSQPATLWVLRTLVLLGALLASAAAGRVPIQGSEGSQYARPDGYASSDGTWSGTFADIDEVTPSDADFLASPSGPSFANFYEVMLSDVLPPTDLSAIVLRYRYAKSGDDGGRITNLTVELRQGGAVIASQSHAAIPGVSGSGWQQGTLSLTPALAEAITDYTDLRLRLGPSTTGGGTPRKALVTWAELELPAAAEPVSLTERVSVSSVATEGNAASLWPTLSADGRYVAFTSSATNLVTGDTNAKVDVFVHDRATGATSRVSIASDGTQGDGSSQAQAISADGRYVAFQSLATNLVPGDTNGVWDVYVHDRESGTTTRVSVASDGTGGSFHAALPTISADGQYVSFESSASNLVPGDTNGAWDVFVHDRATGATTRVSVASDGTQGNQQSDASALSADGGSVTFQSMASNLVPGDSNGYQDVFVHDRTTGTTSRVSLASDGAQANWISSAEALGIDGRYVAFSSIASNLVPGDTNQELDAFVQDRTTGTTTRVSVASDGTQANDYSGAVVDLSDDGQYVVFSSLATNLVPGDTNGVYDVLLHDRATGTTSRVGVATYGTQGNADSHEVTISGDGQHAAFQSWANNLVPDDTNNTLDVFVRGPELPSGAPPDVALTSPAAGATLFGSEVLSATATHQSGIAEVEFLVDDAVVGAVATEPFAFTWDTTTVADGPHAVEARATAVSG
jgi:archaellum component FlaF (FlaF/FlaG flagellin family)